LLPIGAGAEVGREPTAAVDAGADVVADAGEVGKWGRDGTPSSASGEHYRTEMPRLPLLCLLVGAIASSAMMTLLLNSGNDPPVLSAMCSCSFVERPIMK
jgi:hypothetical protein